MLISGQMIREFAEIFSKITIVSWIKKKKAKRKRKKKFYFSHKMTEKKRTYTNLIIFSKLIIHWNQSWKSNISTTDLRGYCTPGTYFWRLCVFSQKIKPLWTKCYPIYLIRTVPRNSKITVLFQYTLFSLLAMISR